LILNDARKQSAWAKPRLVRSTAKTTVLGPQEKNPAEAGLRTR